MAHDEPKRDAARERVAEVRRRFAEKLGARVHELTTAIERARAGEARLDPAIVLAHQLAGTAGSYGYVEAGQHAAAIEITLRRIDSGHSDGGDLEERLELLRDSVRPQSP